MLDLWPVILGILIAISLLTIIMNILVATAVLTTKKLQTVTNIYLASLSFADTFVGFIVMGAMAVYTIYGYWPLGSTACTIWVIFDYCCCTVSMLHLDVIAFQRFKAINDPLGYHAEERKNSKQSVKHITAIWAIGILVWLPAILYFRIKSTFDGDIDETDCLFLPSRDYIITQSCIVYFIPVIIMVYYYSRTVHMFKGSRLSKTFATHSASREENEAIAPKTRSDSDHFQVQGTIGNIKSISSQALLQKRIKQEKRLSKMLGIVIVCFLVCWLPFCLFWPIEAFCPDCIPLKAYEASIWMAFINSTVNPILIFTMNKDYRKALKKNVIHSNEVNPSAISTVS
ncbi:unnamed protein product [Owenia fusiformis]|uniref:Uncharacterized protein n=1 Tax=Owenia fusiformis TaxID=6347 RepID=A0A8J1Y3L9_OWEFU|nr:unnamed protein product [Owenia fusiformis]